MHEVSFFPQEPTIPAPPKEFEECGLEWRIGWTVGWESGPGIEPKWNGRYPKIGRYSPMASKRQLAVRRGLEAGREAKKALVAENLPDIEAGERCTAVWHNYPRDGFLYADAFFFPYSNSRLPACVPLSEIQREVPA